jgi:hypothetical protein
MPWLFQTDRGLLLVESFKILSMLSWPIPRPLSLTSMCTSLPRRRALRRTRLRANLIAFEMRFSRIRSNIAGSVCST